MGLRAKLFAAVYDRMMGVAEEAGLAACCEALLAGAAGRVVEIGGGTGANLPFYRRSVSGLVIAEAPREVSQGGGARPPAGQRNGLAGLLRRLHNRNRMAGCARTRPATARRIAWAR